VFNNSNAAADGIGSTIQVRRAKGEQPNLSINVPLPRKRFEIERGATEQVKGIM
jgi:hypothetical protein